MGRGRQKAKDSGGGSGAGALVPAVPAPVTPAGSRALDVPEPDEVHELGSEQP